MYGSSRLIKALTGNINATTTGFTTRFGKETFQIRVETNIPGGVWVAVFDSTGPTTDFVAATSTSSTPIYGTLLNPEWDYFTVTPGQFLVWKSTSTSTVSNISVTEMS